MTLHYQAWDWVLPIKTEICLSSGAAVSLLGGFGGMPPKKFFLIGTLCCNLGALKYICIVLEKNHNLTFLRKITII